MLWEINGVERQTGKDVRVELDADDEGEAVRVAGGMNVIVADARPLATLAIPYAVAGPPPPGPDVPRGVVWAVAIVAIGAGVVAAALDFSKARSRSARPAPPAMVAPAPPNRVPVSAAPRLPPPDPRFAARHAARIRAFDVAHGRPLGMPVRVGQSGMLPESVEVIHVSDDETR